MNWKLWLKHGFKFSRHVALRSQSDSINVTAGHLTYVSLLSLVPLLVVTFTVFSAFPVFDDLKNNIESALFANLLPTSGEQLKEYIDEFVGNASQMTAVGIAFLFFVAVALISAIDSALNNIWRDTSSRRWTVSFAIYWMILTLGPVLIGTGLAATSYLVSLSQFAETYVSGIRSFLLSAVPVVTSFIAFVLLYQLVHNRPAKFRYAA